MPDQDSVATQRESRRWSTDAVGDDNAVTPVPQSERRSGWSLSWLSAGITSSLLQLTIAGTITTMVGSRWGLAAGVLVAAFVTVISSLFGEIARVEGLSSTILPRFYGLGRRGSAISSLVFATMIIGLLASENVLLYHGTLFALGWSDTTGNAVLIYGLLTATWIVLSIFGIGLITRVSSALVVAFIALLGYMVVRIYTSGDVTVADAFSQAATSLVGSDTSRFIAVVGMLAGQGAALALVNADYCRYATSTRAVVGVSLVGALMLDVVGIAMGILLLTGGNRIVGEHLVATGQATVQDAAHAAGELATQNTGAYFVVLAGTIGFLLMYVAQVKVQTLNVYSGALALSNLWDVLARRRPNHPLMIVIANAVAIAMVVLGVFEQLAAFLSALGVVMFGFIALAIADYYIVRRRRPRTDPVSEFDGVGVGVLAVSSAIAFVLAAVGVMPFGFITSTVLVLVLHPVARRLWPRPARADAEPVGAG